MTTETAVTRASVQGELWGRQAQTWATDVEPLMHPLYEATLDALEPLNGLRLLDAGCGAGLALSMAAGRGATVAGHDASERLLRVARDREPGAELSVGSIEALPHDASTFDVVVSFNAIQYTVDPVIAVAELARVCRPGGGVAIGIWGDDDRCETEALFARLRSLAPPPPGTPAPLACSDRGMVEKLLSNAGFEVTGGDEAPCPFTFDDTKHAWTAHSSAGPLQKLIDVVGEDAVRAVVVEAVTADRKPDGAFRQDNVFRYVTGIKP